MIRKPIEMANDADLRLSWPAMQRAAQRARDLALRTGTADVISRQGNVAEIGPTASACDPTLGDPEPTEPPGDRP